MRVTIVSLGLVATGLVFAVTNPLPPTWLAIATAGRSQTGEEALRDSNDRRLDLEEASKTARQRSAVTEEVATQLCDRRLTLPKAIDAIEPLVRVSPDWFRSVQVSYQGFSQVATNATEREVIAVYLLHKIEQLADQARVRGDTSRAAAISARRAELANRAALPAIGRASPPETRTARTEH